MRILMLNWSAVETVLKAQGDWGELCPWYLCADMEGLRDKLHSAFTDADSEPCLVGWKEMQHLLAEFQEQHDDCHHCRNEWVVTVMDDLANRYDIPVRIIREKDGITHRIQIQNLHGESNIVIDSFQVDLSNAVDVTEEID